MVLAVGTFMRLTSVGYLAGCVPERGQSWLDQFRLRPGLGRLEALTSIGGF